MKKITILFAFIYLWCGLKAQLTETFDTEIPGDWIIANNNSDGYYFKTPAQYSIGGTYAYAAAMGCTDDYLITPHLSVSASNNTLTFDAAVENSTYKYSFEIMVSTESADISDFTSIQTFTNYDNTSWTQETIDLSAYNGDNIYIAFHVTSAGATYYSFGFDNITAPPIYVNPNAEIELALDSDFAILEANSGSSQVNLTISNTGGADMTITGISVSEPYSASWSGTIASGANQTVQVTYTPTNSGIADNTLTVNYSGTVDGDNSITLSGMAYSSSSQTESFEGTWPPTDWSSTSWNTSSSYAYDGSYSAYCTSSSSNLLSTPKLDIQANDIAVFYAKGSYSDASITVKYSGNGTNWTDLETKTIAASSDWTAYAVDLSSAVGINYLGFSLSSSYCPYLDYLIIPATYVATTPVISLSLDSDFEFIEENTTDTVVLNIANEGIGSMLVTGITVASPFSSDFSDDITVAEGGTETVNLIFSPTTSGGFSETLTVSLRNAFDGENTIQLEAAAYTGGSLFEDFESDTPWLPLGWSAPDGGWSHSTYSGTNSSSAANGGSGKTLITPLLDIENGDKLQFYGRKAFSWDPDLTITIRYSGDKETWTSIETVNITSNTYEAPFLVDVSAAAGSNYISLSSNGAWYLDDVIGPYVNQTPILELSFDENFDLIPANSKDTVNLTIANIGFSDLTIDNLTIPAPFSGSFSGTIASGNSETIEVIFEPTTAGVFNETLTVNTSQSFNGDDNISLEASAYSENYIIESFEDETSAILPAGWTETDDNVSWSWNVATFASYTGSNSIYRGGGNYSSTLFTPLLDMATGNHQLHFYWKQAAGGNNALVIKLSTDGGNTFTTLDSLYEGTNNIWTNHSINLGSPGTDQCMIAFVCMANASSQSIYLDNVIHPSYTIDNSTAGGSGDWTTILGTTNAFSIVTIPSGVTLTIPASKEEAYCYDLNVEPGGEITVEGTLNITNELIIESDASGSGSFINTGTVNVNNQARIQQYLAENSTSYNWHYVASPVPSATAGVFPGVDHSGTVYAVEWVEATHSWSEITTTSNPLTTGLGYAVPVNSATTVEYTGNNIISGNQTINSLTFTSGNHEGYHLLGNPFTAAIEASQLVVGDGTNWTGDIWIRTDGGFEEFNISGGTGTFSVIPAMQAFWIRNDGLVGDMEITLDPAKLVHSSQALYKNASNNEIRFELVDGDKSVIYLNEEATAGFENFATEIRFVDEATEIWTMAADKPVAINGISVENEATIAVGFKTATGGTFTFNFTSIAELDANFDVYLKDNQTGNITDLRKSDNYEFYSDITDNTSRFSIIITKSATDIDAIANGVSIYSNNNTVFVNAANAIDGTLSVYDVSGNIIMSRAVNYSSGVNTFELNETSGVYIININSANVNLTEKIVIK